MRWEEVELRLDEPAAAQARPSVAARVRLAVIPALVAVLLAVAGHLRGALLLGAAALVVAVVAVRSPAGAAAILRAMAAFGRGVGTALRLLLCGVVALVVFFPVSVMHLLRPGDGLRPRHVSADGWVPRPPEARPVPQSRPFGRDDQRRAVDGRVTTGGWVVRIAGVVAVVLIVDVVAGAVLNATGVLPGPSGELVEQLHRNAEATIASPAMADSPWIREYQDEIYEVNIVNRVPSETYRNWVLPDVAGRYVNVLDGERRSYTVPSPQAGVRPLEVAFFGGSTTFGDGQRDEHTIPSEIARLAEAVGVPIRVHNFGVLGYVSWQELLAYESRAARAGPFDLVVFYDGFNDLSVQQSSYSVDPVSGATPALQAFRDTFVRDHGTEPGFTDGFGVLWAAYARVSGAVRLWSRYLGQPTTYASGYAVHGSEAEVVEATLGIYARAQARAIDIAEQEGSRILFFWQPTRDGWPAGLVEGLPEPTIDLTHALDGHPELYSDPVHTNEQGAAMVAAAMWPHIEPHLREIAATAPTP